MASTNRRVLGEKDANASVTPSKQYNAKNLFLTKQRETQTLFPPQMSYTDSEHLEPSVTTLRERHVDTAVLARQPSKRSFNEAIEEGREDVSGLKRTKMNDHLDDDEGDSSGSHTSEHQQAQGAGISNVTVDTDRVEAFVEPTPASELAASLLGHTPVDSHDAEEAFHATPQALQETQASWSGSSTLVDSVNEPSVRVNTLYNVFVVADRNEMAELLRYRLRFAMSKIRSDQREVSQPSPEPPVASPGPKQPLIIRDPPEKTMRRFRRQRGRVAEPPPTGKQTGLLPPFEPDGDLNWAANPGFAQDAQLSGDRNAFSDPAMKSVHSNTYEKPAREIGNVSDSPLLRRSYSSWSEGESEYEPSCDIARNTDLDRVAYQDKDLTSSAVKGRAADSLLQLGGGR